MSVWPWETDYRSVQHNAERLRLVWFVRAVVICLTAASVDVAASPPLHDRPHDFEYQVKAAFLYNFAKFVEWPGDATEGGGPALIIGVLGDDPFGPALDDTVSGKSVNGRGLEVKRFSQIGDLEPCQVLFVGTSMMPRLPEILSRVRGSPVLTIGEADKFAQDGGIVRLVTENNKVRFEINVDAAERAGLRISSKLLALARIVHQGEQTGH